MTERKPLVYIAGPYTNPDPVENTHRAIKAGMEVWEWGLAVPIIPHLSLLAHVVQPRGVDYWYDLDLAQLDHCDALVRLPGESTGADREVEHAKARGIPCFDSLIDLKGYLYALASKGYQDYSGARV